VILFMTKEKTTKKDFMGLRTKREALGLTLKDVCQRTRVSVVNLEAIENGDFHNLPVSIYAKNFIKTYARTLDFDSKPILDSYEGYLDSLQVAKTQTEEPVPGKESLIKRVIVYKTYIWIASIIIVIAVVAIIISQQNQPAPDIAVTQPGVVASPEPATESTPVNPPAVPNEQTNAAVQPAVQPVAPETNKQAPVQAQPTNTSQKSVSPLKASPEKRVRPVEKKAPAVINEETNLLVIRAAEETWLRIKIDQNPSFQVLLKPGEKIERKGATFDMDIGNAAGIKMQFKDKSIENLGKTGQVIHLRLP
jgi:cytoskeleton protein RodZ